MNRFVPCVVAVSAVSTSALAAARREAERDADSANALRLNVPVLPSGTLDGQFEHALDDHKSIALRGTIVTPAMDILSTPAHFRGMGVGMALNYYTSDAKKLDGFFVGGGLDLNSVAVEDDTSSGTAMWADPFVHHGYNWNYENGLNFGLDAGLGMYFVRTEGTEQITTTSGAFLPKFAVNLGYSL